MRRLALSLLLSLLVLHPNQSDAFCGFYVAKADASLFNKASQVVVARDGDKTALTMFNDYKGTPSEFALVVPVPEVLTKEQINVGEKTLIEHLDAYSAPRLVEYFDSNPCAMLYEADGFGRGAAAPQAAMKNMDSVAERAKALGVSIEAQYTVGEYDILILGAKESTGLETWLKENGYKVPKGASKVLSSYLKQGMKFFVAKVNLKEQEKAGFSYLRPIQFAFESPKFMLPIRLGMVNSDGPQDLVIYAITKKGRVETTNYRTVKLPSDAEVPLYVKSKFADFYRAVFDTAHVKEDRKVVFLEYAWNMAWCDPCAADPMTHEELRKLGVFWLADNGAPPSNWRKVQPLGWSGSRPVEAFITRLHVRYDGEHFPEDLTFQETSDSANFQGRYILRHPYTGDMACDAARRYQDELKSRWTREAETLASLTGWKIADVRKAMGENGEKPGDGPTKKWYQNIFK